MKNAFQDEGFLWDLLSMESMESHWLLAMLTKQHHTECKQPNTRRHLSLQTMQTATDGFSSVQICDLMHCGKKVQNIYYFSTSTNSAQLYQMLSLSTTKERKPNLTVWVNLSSSPTTFYPSLVFPTPPSSCFNNFKGSMLFFCCLPVCALASGPR